MTSHSSHTAHNEKREGKDHGPRSKVGDYWSDDKKSFQGVFALKHTKVADDAADIAAAENVALVEHHERNWKAQAKMNIDEVDLKRKLVLPLWRIVFTYLGFDVPSIYTINICEAEVGRSHEAKCQNHSKNRGEELEMHRSQRPTRTPYDHLAHEIDDDDPAKLQHIAGDGDESRPPEI